VAAPVEQVGVIIACPGCGAEVLQKTMIPLGVTDGVVSYSCVSCARTQITTIGSGETT
jgi:DNA-directed RNA polymerase subunit RPC12/RpoP